MHVVACFDIARCLANELAVFDNRLACLDILTCHFMKQGHILVGYYMTALPSGQGVCHLIAGMKRVDSYDHVIAIVDNNAIPHWLPFSR